MSQISGKEVHVEIPLYALPKETDLKVLTPLVREAAANLEQMGVFDQREFEPAHVFVITKGSNP